MADVRLFAETIDRFLTGRTLQDFTEDSMLRAAVERVLQNIGEALAQLSRIAPELAHQVPRHRGLIGLRNVLVHGYSGLNTEELWEAIQQNLPALLQAAQRLAPADDDTKT
jgi:uncharacterized protein with HEPN domain